MGIDQQDINELESHRLSNLKILIVEDDFASCKVLEEYLGEYGDCSVAVDGAEAIEAFKKALADGEGYGVVCLDIMLPTSNGHLVLKEIERIERDHGIAEGDGATVIMTTAIDDPDDILEAFKEGCKAYIVKPVRIEELLGKMRKLGVIE